MSNNSIAKPKCILVISGTSSGVGKTTVTVGLMAAFASRGYVVQPFKAGPDFLDGMHHEAAIQAGEQEWYSRTRWKNDNKVHEKKKSRPKRRCVNLDGWMMGSPENVLASFQKHSDGADVCIIEGAMGLHDSRDGTTDAGSAAQIAKLLCAPVVLVIDGSMMARSVAAMALGYAIFDGEMRLGGVVANKVGGPVHIQWIREAIELEGKKGRLKDIGTDEPSSFLGALPNDLLAAVPERHLGLTMPMEQQPEQNPENLEINADPNHERFLRLAALVEENLDLDKVFKLGQTCQLQALLSEKKLLYIPPMLSKEPMSTFCRIGIAEDEAFCFYYRDNLHLLHLAGAELVPFSPLTSKDLPPSLDAIYIGGGYPELHSHRLQENKQLRRDIRSFCHAGGAIFAECGGLMYLSDTLLVSKKKVSKMCGVYPITTRMTPHAKMYYANIEFTCNNPLFPVGGKCRGQKFHFSEIVQAQETDNIDIKCPFLVTPELPGAISEAAGIVVKNSFASYFHLHFASYIEQSSKISFHTNGFPLKTLADHFVQNAVKTSPYRQAYAVSFVSAATEIVFALQEESALAGVTSICDFPMQARHAPRRVICRPSIDAASLTSEEVAAAMDELKSIRESQDENGPPRYWYVDSKALCEMKPKVAFVQNTCEICDASSDDVLHALNENNLRDINVIKVAPTTLNGLFDSIRDISVVLNISGRGEDLCKSLQERLKRVRNEVSRLTSPRPKLLSLEGLAPLCAGGHWLPDLKYEAGCIDATGDTGGCAAKILTWDDITAADPDILMISPCSATTTRTLNELHLLASTPQFWKLRCVQKGLVYVVDHEYFARPGPRIVEGVEMMATLFRNISPPSQCILDEWKSKALKYECSTNGSCNSISHCTTELGARFIPCFRSNERFYGGEIKNEQSESIENTKKFRICNVTRCTIPSFQSPENRSAHCMLPIYRMKDKKLSFLLIGGENNHSNRLNDTWELHSPSKGWASTPELNAQASIKPIIGTPSTWEYLRCGKVAGEDVPTRRSNHAAVACGDHVLVFGGWGVDNVTPLSHCELLHTETLCWTHCSTRGSSEPLPRGNPTLVYSEGANCAYLFGGWNGKQAFNDLWYLDMNTWQWGQISQNLLVDDGASNRCPWPSPRTDHTAAFWQCDNGCEHMLVFGGNVEGSGPTSELWDLQLSQKQHISKGEESYSWKELEVSGPKPPPRTSHTTGMVGTGELARMVIVGGTSLSLGTGRGSMLCDAWILNLGKVYCETPTWLKLDWSGYGLNRCRHSMVVVDSAMVLLHGGYDGEIAVTDCHCVWQGELSTTERCKKLDQKQRIQLIKKVDSHRLQERWEAEIPARVEDLPPEKLEKAKRSTLPGAVYKALHRYAVAHNRDTYIDPSSGYSVFTQIYLKRKPCCGNGCRHCPHGHVNVPGKRTSHQVEMDSKLDW